MKTEYPLPSPGDPLAGVPPDLLDTAALAAVAMAPSAPVPDFILSGASVRIRRRRIARTTARHTLIWGGWAAAAAACLTLWLRHDSTAGSPSPHKSGHTPGTGLANGSVLPGTDDNVPGSSAGTADGSSTAGSPEKRGRVSPRGQFRTLPGVSDYPVGDNVDQLRDELRRLSNSHAARFQAAPGLARMVVVEMTGPDAQGRSRPSSMLTPERVSDIMAAGLSGDRPPESDPLSGDKPPMRVRPGSRPSEIILEDGLGPLGFLDLPEEVTLRHNAFPVKDWENAGLVKSPDGRFYDPAGHILWEAGTGGQYLGRRVPEDFDASRFATAAPRPADPAPAPPEPSPAVAYTLFDETTGAGSIVLGNLPPAPEGRAYQLWLTDPAQQNPVSVGLLPALDGGFGRVFFDTLAPGFAPSGYFLTLEPASGSPRPGGERILSGPQIPAH